MKKTILYKLLFVLTCIAVISYFLACRYLFASVAENIVCNKLHVVFLDKDLSLISSDFVENVLKNNDLHPLGKKTNMIYAESIERKLNENEMIKSSECYTTPSGDVYIEIKQRIPKFRIFGNENFYIDSERKKFGTSLSYTAYVPVVSGNVSPEMAAGELFDFIDYIDSKKFWNAQIEQIYVRNDKKIELVMRVGDGIVLLGHLDNYEKKLEKLEKMYSKVFDKIGWSHYKLINLEYKGQVVCTK